MSDSNSTTGTASDSPTNHHMTPINNTSWFANAYETIKGYLPSPTSRTLVDHASNVSHEDLSRTGLQDEVTDLEDSAFIRFRNSLGSYPVSDGEEGDDAFKLTSDIDVIELDSATVDKVPDRAPIPPITGIPFHKVPENFGTVVEGSIYRSNYPQEDNFPYLQSLGLRSILTLVTTESPAYDQFIAENGIQQFRVHLPANKDKIKVTDEDMARALEFVLDRENHPILIHCNKGKHRTGCVVGCFRRVVGATTKEDIFREYHKYAGRKARIWDEAFIEKYDTAYSFFAAVANKWIAPPRPPSPESMKTIEPSVDGESDGPLLL